jgi:hypothetical protein
VQAPGHARRSLSTPRIRRETAPRRVPRAPPCTALRLLPAWRSSRPGLGPCNPECGSGPAGVQGAKRLCFLSIHLEAMRPRAVVYVLHFLSSHALSLLVRPKVAYPLLPVQ